MAFIREENSFTQSNKAIKGNTSSTRIPSNEILAVGETYNSITQTWLVLTSVWSDISNTYYTVSKNNEIASVLVRNPETITVKV